jgi:hypothetical protein
LSQVILSTVILSKVTSYNIILYEVNSFKVHSVYRPNQREQVKVTLDKMSVDEVPTDEMTFRRFNADKNAWEWYCDIG